MRFQVLLIIVIRTGTPTTVEPKLVKKCMTSRVGQSLVYNWNSPLHAHVIIGKNIRIIIFEILIIFMQLDILFCAVHHSCNFVFKVFSIFLIRFNTYKEQTMPIIKHYEKLDLVKTIPATGTPNKVVYCYVQ